MPISLIIIMQIEQAGNFALRAFEVACFCYCCHNEPNRSILDWMPPNVYQVNKWQISTYLSLRGSGQCIGSLFIPTSPGPIPLTVGKNKTQ